MSEAAVQRWRLTFRRAGHARDLPAPDASTLLEAAIPRSGLPVATSDGTARPRMAFGPPVGPSVVADEELLDVYLVERMTRFEVRTALQRALPAGHDLVGLDEVWVRAPSLAASVVAADYRVVLGQEVDREALSRAVADVLAAERVDRRRDRGGRISTYDLRRLIDDLRLVESAAGATLEMRLRIDQQLGTGRPEEVLAIIRAMSGLACEPIAPIERGRLHLSPA